MLERLGPVSLAGGSCGENQTHTAPVSAALGSIRRSVLLCAMVIALCLLVQTAAWAVVTFTDLRFAEAPAGDAPPTVVDGEERARERVVAEARGPVATPPAGAGTAADPNRVYTDVDRVLDHASTVALAIGRLAVIALLPWVGLGVVLAVVTATNGVHKAVSGFGWAFVTGLLVFPVAGWFGLPWDEGALWRYAVLTEQVDAPDFAVNAQFLATYLLLPLAALCSLLIGTGRFLAGIRDGLFRREDLRLDTTLESEAGGREAGSLHAGRNAAALERITRMGDEAAAGEIRQVADLAAGAAAPRDGGGDAGPASSAPPPPAADTPPSRPLF